MRKYIDVLNESQQLNEGMIMDVAKKAVGFVMNKFAPELKQLAPIVQKATGGDMSPTKENAAKVMNALGITKDDVAELVKKAQSKDKSEPELSEGLAGTVAKILLKILWAVLVAGGGAALFGLAGPLTMAVEGFWILGGLLAIMSSQPLLDPDPDGRWDSHKGNTIIKKKQGMQYRN